MHNEMLLFDTWLYSTILLYLLLTVNKHKNALNALFIRVKGVKFSSCGLARPPSGTRAALYALTRPMRKPQQSLSRLLLKINTTYWVLSLMNLPAKLHAVFGWRETTIGEKHRNNTEPRSNGLDKVWIGKKKSGLRDAKKETIMLRVRRFILLSCFF